MWIKVFFIMTCSLFISCGDKELKRNFNEIEDLAKEAVALRDYVQNVADSLWDINNALSEKIDVLRDSVFGLTRDKIFLKTENIRLNLELVASRQRASKMVIDKFGNKKSIAVVQVSKPDSINEKTFSPLFDSVAVIISDSVSSFIDFIWEKRNKVEP